MEYPKPKPQKPLGTFTPAPEYQVQKKKADTATQKPQGQNDKLDPSPS